MKIIVCSLGINDWYRDIVKYSINNLDYYCKKNGYEFIFQTENSEDTVFDGQRPPCWYKIKLIKKILEENTDCDYVFWVDIDCQLLNHDLLLEYFIKKYFEEDTQLLLTQDNNVLNTGVMFIKNTQYNKDLMDRIWNEKVDDYFQDFHEQTVLANLYQNNEDVKKHVKILPYGTKDELVIYWSSYFPKKVFLIHCARCTHDKLGFMFMMDTYYPFKLEEENYDEYNLRMDWLNKEEICRYDIDKWIKGEYAPRRYSARCKKIFNVL